MKEEKLEKIREEKLPLIYKFLLKLPMPRLDFLPDSFHGIYWAFMVPMFLVFEFWLSLLLLVVFPSPVNMLSVLIIPAIIFVIFLKITLHRFINWWNSIVAQQEFEWNIEKMTKDYIDLVNKQQSKKNKKP